MGKNTNIIFFGFLSYLFVIAILQMVFSTEIVFGLAIVIGIIFFIIVNSMISNNQKKEKEESELQNLKEIETLWDNLSNERNKEISKVRKKCYDISFKYAHNLALERQKYVFKDPYGHENIENWKKLGVKYFFNKIVVPNLSESEVKILLTDDLYFSVIDNIAEAAQSNLVLNSQSYDSKMSGKEYELFCSDILKKAGWFVSMTKSTGDQGVDLIAEKNNIKIVIQCKNHNSRIGNKAVQEVAAGRIFYNADLAFVVSNSYYTTSAYQLANKNLVKLLHHADLEALDSILAS